MRRTRSHAGEPHVAVLDSEFRKVAAVAAFNWRDRDDFRQEMHIAYLEHRCKLSDPAVPLSDVLRFCKRRAHDRLYRKGKSVDSRPRKDVRVESLCAFADTTDWAQPLQIPDPTDVAEEAITRVAAKGFVKALTSIQRNTILLLSGGYCMADIARIRNVDEATVRECLRAVRRKGTRFLAVQ